MSIFDPVDVRGPDQRRKQLMQRLAQQGRRAVPMPQMASHVARAATMGDGRQFHGASLVRPMTTHGGSVLSSILSRLGVEGQPGAGEFSGGPGSPVSPYGGAGGADPYSRAPSPITGGTPIAPNDPTYGEYGGPRPAPPIGGVPPFGAFPTPGGNPAGAPGVGGGMIPPGGGPASPNAGGVLAGGPPNLVPLGNGMYYDPALDQVVGGGTPPGGGGGGSRYYQV